MQELLEHRHRRRNFFLLIVTIIALLMIVRYFVIPHFNQDLTQKPSDFWASFVEKLSTSLVVTVLIGSFIFWLQPSNTRDAVKTIDSRDISTEFTKAIASASEWTFRGSTGRFTRAKTLPEMAKNSRNQNSKRHLELQLADPMALGVCHNYAEYRRGVQSSTKDSKEWTEDRAFDEICATILCAVHIATKNPLLVVSISLLPTFSSFRLDLSSELAIVTREDSRDPALAFDKDSYFYDAYRTDLMLTSKQGKQLLHLPTMHTLDQEEASACLAAYGITIATAERMQSILKLARSSENPYE